MFDMYTPPILYSLGYCKIDIISIPLTGKILINLPTTPVLLIFFRTSGENINTIEAIIEITLLFNTRYTIQLIDDIAIRDSKPKKK